MDFISLLVSVAFLLTPRTTYGYSQPEVPPIMIDIARCESGQQQFYPNGKLVRDGVTGTHVGYYQISEEKWGGLARQLGYDIYAKEGNIKMALYIYKLQGTGPWTASRSCWGTDDS